MRTLYISQTGMLEPLGQSQVIPYVVGLSRRGFEIEIISFERQGSSQDDVSAMRRRLDADGVAWRPLVRRKSPRLSTKLTESAVGVAHALVAALRRGPRIVHARSYFPAAIADVVATVAPGARLLFDARGMLGDEYVDAGYWRRDSTEYRLVKIFEKRLFRRSEGVVVLTRALREWLLRAGMLGPQTSTEVIPCCVDTDRFKPDEAVRAQKREDLGLGDRVVVAYSGTLGAWYLEKEMARFVGLLKRTGMDVVFLVLSTSNTDNLRAAVHAEGLEARDFMTLCVRPEDMPKVLPAADLGLSFIQSCFSKMGSSPTKVAEYLAAGVPVVLNGDIGDQADLRCMPDACIVLSSFAEAELVLAAERARILVGRSYAERAPAAARVAETQFGLANVGVRRYEKLYRTIAA